MATPRFNLTVTLTVGLTDDETASLPASWSRNDHQPHYIQVDDVEADDYAAACKHVLDGLQQHVLQRALVDEGVALEIRSIHVRRLDLPPLISPLTLEEPPPPAPAAPAASPRRRARRSQR